MDIQTVCELIGREGRTFADAVDELVGECDAVIDERLRSLELIRRRAEAEIAATIAVADKRQVYAADGHRGMAGYLRATCNWSNPEVGAKRRLAGAADAVPGLGDALRAGWIGVAQAAAIARVHRNPRVSDRLVEFAPTLLDTAEHLPFDDFAIVLERFEMLADVDGAHDHRDEQIDNRNVHVTTVGGELHLDASGGDPLINDELQAIFRRFGEHEFRKDAAARRAEHGDDAAGKPLARTHGQRSYDAFVELMRRANAHLDEVDGAPSGADTIVNVLVDRRTWSFVLADAGLAPTTSLTGQPLDPFTGLPAGDETDLLSNLLADPAAFATMRCETSNGTALHPHDVLRAALAGHVRRVILDARSVPIDMGRKQRLFTGPAREAAKLLAVRCDHDGCGLPADFCDVDHVVEWSDDGATDQRNAGVRCNHHNRHKHERRLGNRRDLHGRRYTIRPDGSIVLPVGTRPPTFPDDDDDDTDPDDDPILVAERIRIAGARLRALRRPA